MSTSNTEKEIVVFAGGCFWCTEAVFQSLKGVSKVTPGYAGGDTKNPNYDQVSTGRTGHAEAIQIEFNPAITSLEDLLIVFFNTHDPTTVNRQGADVGTQYRSAIFYTTDDQKSMIDKVIADLTAAHAYEKPIVTEVKKLDVFYPAEAYHMDYYRNNRANPYCELVIAPKMEKFEKRFKELLDNTKINS